MRASRGLEAQWSAQSQAARFFDQAAVTCELEAVADIIRAGGLEDVSLKLMRDVRITAAYASVLAGLPMQEELAEARVELPPSHEAGISADIARTQVVEAIAVGALDASVLEDAKARDRALGPLCASSMESLSDAERRAVSGCPPEYLDPPPAETDADLAREEAVFHAVHDAMDRGEPDAILCAIERAARDVADGVDDPRDPDGFVLTGSAQRLYHHAYLGALLGLETAEAGAPACRLLDALRRESQRRYAWSILESAVEDGHLPSSAMSQARARQATADFCQPR